MTFIVSLFDIKPQAEEIAPKWGAVKTHDTTFATKGMHFV